MEISHVTNLTWYCSGCLINDLDRAAMDIRAREYNERTYKIANTWSSKNLANFTVCYSTNPSSDATVRSWYNQESKTSILLSLTMLWDIYLILIASIHLYGPIKCLQ